MEFNELLMGLESKSEHLRNIIFQDNSNNFHVYTRVLKNHTKYRLDFRNEVIGIPFVVADEVPIFTGFENADDKRAYYNENIQLYISKNFRYPNQTQEAGIQGRVSVIFRISSEGTEGKK